MFELEEYKINGHFFYSEGDDLKKVCNASRKGVGVFLMYVLKGGKIELMYIGSAGKVNQKGVANVGKDGLYGELVNGLQFGQPRNISLENEIKANNIEALDIYWFETIADESFDIPSVMEGVTIQK